MTDLGYLAARYALHHRGKSLTIAAAIGFIVFLPLGLETLVREAELRLRSRARTTPLVVGPQGSDLDLAVATLYLQQRGEETLPMEHVQRIEESGLARGIPLHLAHLAQRTQIVGTQVDYLEYRGLRMAEGRPFVQIGECVVGAAAATSRGWRVGDSLISSTNNAFDLAGAYPLKIRIVGVLEATGEADDEAIFCDIKTTWIMDGLGHGHQAEGGEENVAGDESGDESGDDVDDAVLQREEGMTTYNAALPEYQEITPENIDSFHFHGSPGRFPVSSVIAVPRDRKAATLLRGRYLAEKEARMIRPAEAIERLLHAVVRVRSVVLAGAAVVGLSVLLLLALVSLLSWQLRRDEFRTLRRLGATRGQIQTMLLLEFALLGLAGGAMAVGCSWCLRLGSAHFLQLIITWT